MAISIHNACEGTRDGPAVVTDSDNHPTVAVLELVLIDDASTDETTVAALTRLTNRDQRIRLTRRDQNGGISAASNQGLVVADWRISGESLETHVDRIANV